MAPTSVNLFKEGLRQYLKFKNGLSFLRFLWGLAQPREAQGFGSQQKPEKINSPTFMLCFAILFVLSLINKLSSFTFLLLLLRSAAFQAQQNACSGVNSPFHRLLCFYWAVSVGWICPQLSSLKRIQLVDLTSSWCLPLRTFPWLDMPPNIRALYKVGGGDR